MKISIACLILVIGLLSSSQVQAGHICPGWRWWWTTSSVTYTVRNVLSESAFEHTQKVVLKRCEAFIRVMERAADNDKAFRFDAKFFNFELGYFITAVNDLFGNYAADSTYWSFLIDGQFSSLGVSNYRPAPGEHLMLNFTNISPPLH